MCDHVIYVQVYDYYLLVTNQGYCKSRFITAVISAHVCENAYLYVETM